MEFIVNKFHRKMILSIIIPIYKVEKYLEKCLKSVLVNNESRTELEIIVVDDGSPDKSFEIAKNLLAEVPNARIIQQQNQGLGGARNTGIENATGEYVWFIDSDDWISSDSLSILNRAIDKYERPDLLMFRAADVVNDKEIVRQAPFVDSISTGLDIFCRGSLISCAPFQIIKRKILIENNIQFIPGIYHEDTEFMPRLAYYSKTVAQIDDVLYFVRQNPASITRSINPKKAFDMIEVCKRLSTFMDSHNFRGRASLAMHRLISITLNNAFFELTSADKKVCENFETALSQSKNLFRHLRKSNVPKYILEWFLFKFTHSYISVYETLCAFKS